MKEIPEVDAVLALHSGPGLGEDLPALPNAVARRDLTLYEGENTRMKAVGEAEAPARMAIEITAMTMEAKRT